MKRSIFYFFAAASLLAGAKTSLAGSIISEERYVIERGIAPLRQRSSSSIQTGSKCEPKKLKTAASLYTSMPDENLIDQIDVYSLSSHARRLALPRMAPPAALLRAKGKGAVFPSSAEWGGIGVNLRAAAGKRRVWQNGSAPQIWEDIIKRASAEHGLPPELVAAVIRVESDFDPGVVSHKGAKGLMQLMPVTQREVGVEDPFDPESNVRGGCAYLRRQLDRFGSLELALAAYNAGPGAVLKYNGVPPYDETLNYVAKVLRHYGRD